MAAKILVAEDKQNIQLAIQSKLLKSSPITAQIPVVFLTNYGYGFMREQALSNGAVDYVVKSDVRLADIAAITERILQENHPLPTDVSVSRIEAATSSPHSH